MTSTDPTPTPTSAPLAPAESSGASPPASPEDLSPEAASRRRFKKRWAAAFLALVGVGIVAFTTQQAALVSDAADAHEAFLSEIESSLSRVTDLSDEEIADLRRSRNATHVEEAQARGIPPVTQRAALADSADAGGLVPLASNASVNLLDATHSIYRATPGVAVALDSISARFGRELETRGLPQFRFTVSSLLRSGEDQANLSGTNVNAVRGRSSHEYGTTFDITYRRFDFDGGRAPEAPSLPEGLTSAFATPLRQRLDAAEQAFYDDIAMERAPALAAILGRVLITLEDDSVLVALRERRQPVYHVTETNGDTRLTPLAQ